MSNLTDGTADDRYAHEVVHVWQNRILGPLYIWSYIAWFIVFGIVIGTLVAFIKRVAYEADSEKATRTPPDYVAIVKEYAYYNNPWETMGYSAGGGRPKDVVWNTGLVIFLALLFYGTFLYAAYQVVKPLWL